MLDKWVMEKANRWPTRIRPPQSLSKRESSTTHFLLSFRPCTAVTKVSCSQGSHVSSRKSSVKWDKIQSSVIQLDRRRELKRGFVETCISPYPSSYAFHQVCYLPAQWASNILLASHSCRFGRLVTRDSQVQGRTIGIKAIILYLVLY